MAHIIEGKDANADLEALRPWLTKLAKAFMRINGVLSWEDLAQEGWVAMWKAHQRWNGTGDVTMWLKANARWRMKTILSRRRDDMAVDWDVNSDDEIWQLASGDVVDEVMDAYHSGEIMAAIDKLSPKQREYVMLRFYMGYEHPQLEAHFGYNPGALWSSKKNGARYKLMQELEHLAVTV
jgi:RNA polymerase sigma factor (sigma-70 family)